MAVLLWLLLYTQLFLPAQWLHEARFDVHCCSWVEGSLQLVSVMEGLLCCSTVMFGHSRLQMWLYLCIIHRNQGIMHLTSICIVKIYVNVYCMCVCRCCTAQPWLSGVLTGSHSEGFPMAVVLNLTAQLHIVTYCWRQCKKQWPFMLLLSSLHMCSCVYMFVCVRMLLHVCMHVLVCIVCLHYQLFN